MMQVWLTVHYRTRQHGTVRIICMMKPASHREPSREHLCDPRVSD
jgi:hypothetical protein